MSFLQMLSLYQMLWNKVARELRGSFYLLPEDAQVRYISEEGDVCTIRECYWCPRMCTFYYMDTTRLCWEYVSSPQGLYPAFK